MDKKDMIAKMVKVFMEIESQNEILKDLKADAKEAGLNAAVLSQVAKAVVANKVDELKEKSNETLEAIEESRS